MRFVELYNEPAGITLHSYQRLFSRRIIRAVVDQEGTILTGLWSRQSGKSESISSLVSALCIFLPSLARHFPTDPRLRLYREGFWVGIFAPKQQQSAIIYDRIRVRAEKPSSKEIYADPDINVAVTQSRGDRVTWSNGSFVRAQTASEQSNIEGDTYHLAIIDEAQLVAKQKVSKEIAPMLSSTNGTMVKIGTANALRGGFKESILFNLQIEKQGGPRNHFEFPYDVVIAERRKTFEHTNDPRHLNYEKWVSGELRRLGNNTNNEEFRQNFRLLWQEANLGAIDTEAFLSAADTHRDVEFSCFNRRVVAGLDYGKKRDVTILTIVEVEDLPIIDTRAVVRPGEEQPIFYNKRIIAWYEIQGRKWHEILKQVALVMSQYSCDTIVCDATGVGDPLTETVADLLPGVKVVPFVMSHVGNDQVYKLYIQEIEAGRFRYVAGEIVRVTHEFEQFCHEHGQLLKDRAGVYIRCYAPDGEHDDYCDSAALACWAASLPANVEVEAEPNPIYATRNSRGEYGSSRAERYRRSRR